MTLPLLDKKEKVVNYFLEKKFNGVNIFFLYLGLSKKTQITKLYYSF